MSKDKLDRGWKYVDSPKEREPKDGVYTGGASQSQPKDTPKVD